MLERISRRVDPRCARKIQDKGECGRISLYGKVDSLVPTRLVAANPAAFIEAVPEPTMLAALAVGLGRLGIGTWRRRK
jgi:PEP-CTERM motif-containing protein